MLDVTTTQVEEYLGNSVHKSLKVYFPQDVSTPINKSYVHEESMSLKESILEGKNVEFVGCISSEFSIKLSNILFQPKGKKIVVTIETDDTDEIPLFQGIVDSVKMEGEKGVKTIKAYDVLYTVGQKDIAEWYQGLTFPITVKNFRDSLFEYIGIEQEEASLPNDSITISKQYDPKTLKCLVVLKSICQFNGCFGIINREGNFEYRFIQQIENNAYTPDVEFPFYKKCMHQDYNVKMFERVQIRDNEKDVGITVGTGRYSNKYIVQNNMLAYKLSDSVKSTVATNILGVVGNHPFVPFSSDTNGLPFIECGDVVKFPWVNRGTVDTQNTFVVMNREIKGIQALRDVYEADGQEEASEFITDLNANIEILKQGGGGGDLSDYYTKAETDAQIGTQIGQMETPTGFDIASVNVLPSIIRSDTLYLIRGDIYIY